MMSTAFLQSLADMLGTTEAEARQALADFVGSLHARVEADGSASYAGLGTFRRAGRTLTFEPDPAVALVVNHRYAGMEPISLSGGAPPSWQTGLPDDEHPLGPPPKEVYEPADAEPADAPESDDEDSADLPPLFASDETLMALRDAARDLDTPPSEEAAQWADDMIEAEEEAPAPPPAVEESVLQEVHLVDEPPTPELPPPPVDEDATPFAAPAEPETYSAPDDDDFEDAVEVVEDAPPPAVPTPAAVPPPPPPAPERPSEPRGPRRTAPVERRRGAWPLILLAVVAGIVIVGWFLLYQRETPPVAPPVARADTVQTPLDTATSPPLDTVATTPPAVEKGPLRGTAPLTTGSGFTIVVGGASSAAEAEGLASPFRSQGYRTDVIRGRTGAGATIYRVSVGQFGSRAEAERALNQVRGTDPFPGDAWVNRL